MVRLRLLRPRLGAAGRGQLALVADATAEIEVTSADVLQRAAAHVVAIAYVRERLAIGGLSKTTKGAAVSGKPRPAVEKRRGGRCAARERSGAAKGKGGHARRGRLGR